MVRDDDNEDAASHVALGTSSCGRCDRANEVGLRCGRPPRCWLSGPLTYLTPSRVLELGAGLGLVGLALARRPGFT